MARASSPKKTVYQDPPRKHVLLLSCMDLRLLDETIHFMHDLNLENRFDHLILAGAAMGARQVQSTPVPNGPSLPWKTVFFDHLVTAIEQLKREIKDIFLLEHLDCGAYKVLHPNGKISAQYRKIAEEGDLHDLEKYHQVEARAFAKEVDDFCKEKYKAGDDRWKNIRVRPLLINLTGKVEDL